MKNLIKHSLVIIFLFGFGTAQAATCGTSNTQISENAIHTASANPLTLEFDSGAQWQLCWHVDDRSGLVLSHVYYAGPDRPLRKILDAASIAQVLHQFDEDDEATHMLSEFGFGGDHWTEDAHGCQNGEWLIGDQHRICQVRRTLNLMTRARHFQSLPRREITLHGKSKIGVNQFQQIWHFTEDGEIKPAMVHSGKISRYTNNPQYGVKIDDSNQYAANASLLVNWRLDFNIDESPHNDLIDEFNFTAISAEDLTREINIDNIDTEMFRKTANTDFRGWRISDKKTSSGEYGEASPTRIGYYLDPQPAGYRLVNPKQPWTMFDIAITTRNDCEKLASKNHRFDQDCGASLDDFVNNETVHDLVVWFSLTRHFTPSKEDLPVIRSNRIGFSLIPFDWSTSSPFSDLASRIDGNPGEAE